MNRAINHDASLEKLQRVQGSLTVALVMVPRTDFLSCRPDDLASEVVTRNLSNFSFLPVVDENERVIGLYNAERWFSDDPPSSRVGEDFTPLSEEIVIGADASIFDFIRQADDVPTKLVVSGNGVAGLVSLTDIQQLPVRAALFALVTSLEMAMAMAIEKKWPKPEEWMDCLSPGRREKLDEEISRVKHKDGFVSEIAFTQICDKSELVIKGQLLHGSRNALRREFKLIQDLRNNLAHANSFADTPAAARDVCRIVRNVYRFKDELLRPTERI